MSDDTMIEWLPALLDEIVELRNALFPPAWLNAADGSGVTPGAAASGASKENAGGQNVSVPSVVLRPLQEGNFEGGFAKAKAGEVTDGGQAIYAGTVFTAMLPRSAVAAVLPAGYRLATRQQPGSDHPIVCMLGKQANCKVLIGGKASDAQQRDYIELIVLVPYVVQEGSDRWHNFSVRMYLDALIPVLIGDCIFQYSKATGTFAFVRRGGGTEPVVNLAEVRNGDGNLVFDCMFRATGNWLKHDDPGVAPGFADMVRILQMPMLGILYDPDDFCRVTPPPGLQECSYFEWECSDATVIAIESAIRFDGEVRPGTAGWLTDGDGTWTPGWPEASFGVHNVRWRLALQPPGCVF